MGRPVVSIPVEGSQWNKTKEGWEGRSACEQDPIFTRIPFVFENGCRDSGDVGESYLHVAGEELYGTAGAVRDNVQRGQDQIGRNEAAGPSPRDGVAVLDFDLRNGVVDVRLRHPSLRF
jgi:hypothetical protein